MSEAMLTIDRKSYAEEVGEPEELLDPMPQIAPARGEVSLLPFKLMLPDGNCPCGCGGRLWRARFDIPAEMNVTGCLVRYGNMRPVFNRFSRCWPLESGDRLTITLATGG